ncbi:hypothetical protein GCM10007940_46150 [Portibacter lacus]|uniref:Uncharacterized protein n=1 Tax=Portibacter lacus TaxID=1099794 RepID=A0AA37SUW0_9BACT|nr:hypothetical protein GCM10007940_46150 [Portibacter lacus]
MSAKESNSPPILEETLSARATNPSNTSKIPPKMIRYTPSLRSSDMMAKRPQVRLRHVMKFGIDFFIIKFKVTKKFN